MISRFDGWIIDWTAIFGGLVGVFTVGLWRPTWYVRAMKWALRREMAKKRKNS